ncbi:arachidonate 5-lipoxygenase-like [Anneissia japonica]|uniref:arachidonate 5-lipoxygenase-like n=1 Tax=Anneissia japonica TaxID=1529436 RepID=UPI0014254F51|nr:arachidonate 5-lipoxygenase-like [Anneissia japonica]
MGARMKMISEPTNYKILYPWLGVADVYKRQDLERGQTDIFNVKGISSDFGDVAAIDICNKGKDRVKDDWFAEWVSVVKGDEDLFQFPLNRWIRAADGKLRFQRNDSCLPQFSTEKEQREKELAAKRQLYQFSTDDAITIPRQVKMLPPDEKFHPEYDNWKESTLKNLKLQVLLIKHTTKESLDISQLQDLYKFGFDVPRGVDNWESDKHFGNNLMNGTNPYRITLCKEIPKKLAVTEEMLEPSLCGLTSSEAIDQNRLFYIDYKDLEGIPEITCPIALFFVDDDDDLMPVAIQLEQEPADDNPVFLPTDNKYTWILAKMWFNMADASFHEACSHLCYTHLVTASSGVAFHRNLSPSHPLYRLMLPHYKNVMAINDFGFERLLMEGGAFDRLFKMKLKGSMTLMAKAFKNEWSFDRDAMYPNQIKHRGVEDPKILPKYYYRNDALLYWDAIVKYVSGIVNAHYDEPKKIEDDWELQNFATALHSPDGCDFRGLPGDGKFTDKQQVIEVVATIIFNLSVQHAAVNFGQYDQHAFPLMYSGYVSGDRPRDKRNRTEEDIIDALPPKILTLGTLVIMKFLSLRNTSPLGEIESPCMYDEVGVTAHAQFRRDLKKIGHAIEERNRRRDIPYTVLLPCNVPNDTSI